MVRLENLRKDFGNQPALAPLDLVIPAGEIFGLLGHNGAGKSTTFGLILGQLRPTGGEVFVQGVSVQRERSRALARVGAIFETPAFYDYLSGWRNLAMLTALSRRVTPEETNEAVRFVGLGKRIHDPVRTYSHGMRQRLALAQALLPSPELVLLDEPAEGLDPEGIRELRELILRLNRERGMTVVLSSHLLAEVQHTCSRVAILHHGRLVFEGHWQDLARDRVSYRLDVDDWSHAEAVAAACGATLDAPARTLSLPGAETDVADVVAALVGAGVRVRAVEPVRQSLEDVYLNTVAQSQPARSGCAPV